MDKSKLPHFKNLLIKEREEIFGTEEEKKDSPFIKGLKDEIGELSFYDNHPGDIGTETYEMELSFSLRNHQREEVKNIDKALEKIEAGNYGFCESCGKNIREERLEAIPAAKLCAYCAKRSEASSTMGKDRPVEEEVLYPLFIKSDIDFDNDLIYDGADNWQDMQQQPSSYKRDRDNRRKDSEEVKSIEEISNQEYKKQLPD